MVCGASAFLWENQEELTPRRTNTKAISRTKDTGVTFSNLVQTAVVGVSKKPSCKAKE